MKKHPKKKTYNNFKDINLNRFLGYLENKKIPMLKKARQILGAVVFLLITFLFLDFTGTLHPLCGWLAKVQFLPAVLSLNLAVILALLLLTLLFGRLYCSVICPLGILQDLIARMGRKVKKNRYTYSRPKNWLRYTLLAIFILSLFMGLGAVVALLAPYSSYGRIATHLLAPLWQWGNNLLALIAEHYESYAFYSVEVWIKSWVSLAVAAATLIGVGILAWRNGRTYCNTLCPVGTFLGFIARFSLLKPVIDTSKCNTCGRCARNCKAACIDSKNHQIDYSRCVACMNCINTCTKGAISYRKPSAQPQSSLSENREKVDTARRAFLAGTATLAATSVVHAQEKTTDGGLAIIADKKIPHRATPIVPAGAKGVKHFTDHCTACQLCISVCPNEVLRPSERLEHLMQPEMSYERGYCRPECTRCSEVCPAGAILPINVAEKSSTRIGHAVWVKKNCLPVTDEVSCGNCARHCPAGAIQMVEQAGKPHAPKIPVVNTERCIGCGACENLCPSRPFSAIYVEGHLSHSIN